MIKLCQLCGESHTTISPIYHCGYTYCSNGFYVLRVAGKTEDARLSKEIGDTHFLYRCKELFPSAAALAKMRHAPLKIDPITVTRCEECRGFGFTKKCPHCDGEGEVEFIKDYYTYTPICQRCEGNGVVQAHRKEAGAKRCTRCQGMGTEVDEFQLVRIGKARLSLSQMHSLSRLPMIAWAAHGIDGHFVFCGGDGVLLGRNTDGAD